MDTSANLVPDSEIKKALANILPEAVILPDPLKNKEPVITAAELSFEVIISEPEYGKPTCPSILSGDT